MLTKIKHAFVYGHLFLSIIIVLACYSTMYFLHSSIDYMYLPFLFFSTLCSYNFHWSFTQQSTINSEKEIWILANCQLVYVFIIIGILGSIYFLFQLPLRIILKIIPLIFFTLLYTVPKIEMKPFIYLQKFVIGKTFYLSFFLLYATVYLPFSIAHFSINYLFFLQKFCFIYLICMLFDHKDKEKDLQNGIKTFINYHHVSSFTIIYSFIFSVAICASLILFHFPILNLCIEILPIILLIIVWKKSLVSKEDWWYYFVLDGLLGVSGFLFACFFNIIR